MDGETRERIALIRMLGFLWRVTRGGEGTLGERYDDETVYSPRQLFRWVRVALAKKVKEEAS